MIASALRFPFSAALLIGLLVAATAVRAQSVPVPLGDPVYSFLRRAAIRRAVPVGLATGVRPLSRRDIALGLRAYDRAVAAGYRAGRSEQERRRELGLRFADELAALPVESAAAPDSVSGGWRTLTTALHLSRTGLYRNDRDLISVDAPGFRLRLNPVLTASVTRTDADPPIPTSATSATLPAVVPLANPAARQIESHGFELRAEMPGAAAAYLSFRDTRRRGDERFLRGNTTLPGVGFARSTSPTAIDYDEARGGIVVEGRGLRAVVAKDVHSWGPGLGTLTPGGGTDGAFGRGASLLLGPDPTSYPFALLQATVWRLRYTVLAAQLVDYHFQLRDTLQATKMLAAHRLDVRIGSRVSLGLFESVVYAGRTFEPVYLLPVTVYRSGEHYLGSPDNALLGADLTAVPLTGLELHGQLIIDDLITGRLGHSWAGNKLGGLIGAVWSPTLMGADIDLGADWIWTRPYLYTHQPTETDYRHYGDGLGHPFGPNSDGVIALAAVQPTRFVKLELSGLIRRHGANSVDSMGAVTNVGGDLVRPWDDVNDSPTAYHLAGIRETTKQATLRLSIAPLVGLTVWVEGQLERGSVYLRRPDLAVQSPRPDIVPLPAATATAYRATRIAGGINLNDGW